MPYLYILECCDSSLYVGSTWDLERRLHQDNKGEGANYTKKRLPVKLVYSEEYSSIRKAYLREKQIQKWKTVKKHALIAGQDKELHALSACKNETHHSNKPI